METAYLHNSPVDLHKSYNLFFLRIPMVSALGIILLKKAKINFSCTKDEIPGISFRTCAKSL